MPNAPSTTFKDRIQQLRNASLPFVARTFRGNRLRRYGAASLMLGVLSVFLGIWVSFGTGDFEQDIRRALDLEDARWDQDRIAFQVTAHDPYHHESLQWELKRLERMGELDEYSQLGGERERAYSTVFTALSVAAPAEFAVLERDTRALLEAHPPTRFDPEWHYTQDARDWQFDWYAPQERERLQAIVDRELMPEVVLYTSPLTLMDGVRVTGAVAGGIVVLLLLIVAPLTAGATVAQEVHENTLQPVLGTRLRPVDIVTGLTASGVALGGLLAAPSLAVMLVAALFAGDLAHLAPFLLLLPAASLFTVLLTELVGFGLGKRWSSGIVATILTAALCMLMMFGVGIGMNLEDDMIGLIAMMPPIGLVHGLRELFVPGDRLAGVDVEYATAIGCLAIIGFGALAWIMSRALTRRVEGRTQASLTLLEGMSGAVVSLLLAVAVVPEFDPNDAIPAYFVSLGLASMAWMLIIAGRIPVGDGPAKLRTIPLRSRMIEFFGYVAIHAAVLMAIFGAGSVPLTAMGGFHLLWALAVLALVAVRMVAVPGNILSNLFVALSLMAVFFEFVSAGIFAAAADPADLYPPHAPHPFALFEASAVLGVIQLVLTVAIPLVLIRALRKGSAGLV